jgi:hypothetical protein
MKVLFHRWEQVVEHKGRVIQVCAVVAPGHDHHKWCRPMGDQIVGRRLHPQIRPLGLVGIATVQEVDHLCKTSVILQMFA